MIDCYRPIAGEVTITQYAFKCKVLAHVLILEYNVLRILQLSSASCSAFTQILGSSNLDMLLRLGKWRLSLVRSY